MPSIPAHAAAGQNPGLHRWLLDVEQLLEGLRHDLGGVQSVTQPQPSIGEPPLCSFTVFGQDGRFVIDIINFADIDAQSVLNYIATADNKPAGGPIIFHQLQSSTNSAFEPQDTVTTYGGDQGDPKLHWDITDPQQQKYWRLRSKYRNSDWNTWKILTKASVCGIFFVDSGVLRTYGLSYVNSGMTPTTNPTLTQVGVSTTIRAVANTWKNGDLAIAYNQADFVPSPSAHGTYYCYADDPRRLGGNIFPVASLANPDITNGDGRLYLGKITTAAGGGGTGVGGGGGGCCIAGTLIEMADGSFLAVEKLRRGMIVRGHDGGPELVVREPELIGPVPCFMLQVANGLKLRGCSSFHTFQRQNGGFASSFDLLTGERIVTKKGTSKITRKEYIGDFVVYKVHLDRTHTYLTDGFVSHNALK